MQKKILEHHLCCCCWPTEVADVDVDIVVAVSISSIHFLYGRQRKEPAQRRIMSGYSPMLMLPATQVGASMPWWVLLVSSLICLIVAMVSLPSIICLSNRKKKLSKVLGPFSPVCLAGNQHPLSAFSVVGFPNSMHI